MQAGSCLEARDAHLALLSVHEAMFHIPSPSPVKAVLAAQGDMADTVRLPIVAANEAERQHILSAIEEYTEEYTAA
jgi:4-hydroxy-tetrahydrodipicolinate synthase